MDAAAAGWYNHGKEVEEGDIPMRLVKRVLLLLIPLLLALGAAALAEEPAARIELEGEAELDWLCGVPYAEPGYTAYSAAGEDVTASVRVEGEPVVWRVGDYVVRYLLTDGTGACVSAQRTVHVIPQTLPETVMPPKGTICLTFDDGPCEDTAEVLDILKKYDIHAAFFIIGNRTRYLDLLPRIVEEGHTLGIHCYDHQSYGMLYRDEEHYFTDLMRVQEIIYEKTGDYAHTVRFPGGAWTASYLYGTLPGGSRQLYAMLADMGIREYDWNVQPESEEKTVEGTIVSFTHPASRYEYAVVLQHDARRFSVRALEQMIQWALDEGYTFARLDETFPEIHRGD